MIVSAWRVVKTKYRKTAFDGEGARKHGGRWNSPGKRMIYTSGSVPLALLEMLVHIDSSLLRKYVAIPVSFEDSLVSMLDFSKLPDDWKSYPGPFELKNIGDEWLDSLSKPVLKTPSVIVPQEWNYLLNLEHPDFSKITISISDTISMDIDHRLLERGSW